MGNNENSNLLTVGQLLEILNQQIQEGTCDLDTPIQAVQVIHERGINSEFAANLVFVENSGIEKGSSYESVIYLHTEIPGFAENNAEATVTICNQSENFADTVRKKFILMVGD